MSVDEEPSDPDVTGDRLTPAVAVPAFPSPPPLPTLPSESRDTPAERAAGLRSPRRAPSEPAWLRGDRRAYEALRKTIEASDAARRQDAAVLHAGQTLVRRDLEQVRSELAELHPLRALAHLVAWIDQRRQALRERARRFPGWFWWVIGGLAPLLGVAAALLTTVSAAISLAEKLGLIHH